MLKISFSAICGSCACSLIAWSTSSQDVAARLSHVERAVAYQSPQMAWIDVTLDRLGERVTRIEKRLDLIEG